MSGLGAGHHFRTAVGGIREADAPHSESRTDDTTESGSRDYKKYANVVGGIETAKPGEVSAQMAQLLQTYQNLQQPDFYEIAWFHMAFEKIHPFYDGNGRVGRLLLLKMCLENDIVPFYINSESKMFYYAGLKEWQTQGKPNRLLDVFLSMQDDMKAVLDYFEIDYDHTETISSALVEQHKNWKL